MNEQKLAEILDLAHDAGLSHASLGDESPYAVAGFIELLIKECIWEVIKDDQVPKDIQVLISERLTERFGVEE